ncbi:DUF3078 domain-containing protein [bacterium]|nr:MAG: DUF3078 domain-containing protein [bacterium]
MKTLLVMVYALVIMISQSLVAQDTTGFWKTGGALGLNFNQVGLKNWSGGGENSLAVNGLVNGFANMKKDKISWDNTLELGYGLVKQGDLGVRKSDDKIVLTSKFGREAIEYWSFTGLLDFRTQFANGFDYKTTPKSKISEFMSPAYLMLSLGAEFKPNDNFFALISPITGKMTFVLDDTLSHYGAYGVDPGKTVRSELGWNINSVYKRKLMENTDFQTKLNLFSSYEDLEHIDVNWENMLLLKVNKYITSTVSTNVIYDYDIKDTDGKAKWQLKEVIAVGILYNF